MNRLLLSALTFSSLAALAAVASLLGGCADDVAEPYELTHPRILAIRTEPAVLPAGSEGRLDVLFTDGVTPPRLATADEISLSLDPALDEALGHPDPATLFTRGRAGEGGWQLRAPDEATLAAVRAQLGLAAGAAVPLPVDVQITSSTASLRAQKAVSFGTFVGNPDPPRISIADQPVAATASLPSGSEISLHAEVPAASLAGPADDVTYRWFSSIGELRRYTQALALIETNAEEAGREATLLVVARTPAGGVSWNFVSLVPSAVTSAAQTRDDR
jgi:hypothetical protein